MLTAAILAGGCNANTKVAIVNPTDRALFVQINERDSFRIDAGTTVTATLPSLDRLAPISITARDERGATIFFVSTSLPRIESTGNKVELQAPTTSGLDPGEAAAPYR